MHDVVMNEPAATATERRRLPRDWPTLLLAGGLGLTMVVLAAAILVGVINGERELSETGVRALTVAITGAAGVLGFQVGRATHKD